MVRLEIHAKFIIRWDICTDCMGAYNGYKTRKTKEIQAYGLRKHLLIPAKPAKDKVEHVNCSPHIWGSWLTKRFKVKKIRSGDRLPAKTGRNDETSPRMP
jgi:hypothetical protein